MYQGARYICEGNTMYICKCIKMHGMYVKEKLYVYIYIYISKCIKMHGMYVKDKQYVYKCIKMQGIYVMGTLYIYINVSRCAVYM